jgi:hypothetical protein
VTTELKFDEATGQITALKLSRAQIKELKRFMRRLMSGATDAEAIGQLDPTLIPIAIALVDRICGTDTRWRIDGDRLVPMDVH